MKRLVLATCVLATILLAVGIYYIANYNTANYNFDVVQAGKIYRSGQPDEALLSKMVSEYKVKTIISLRGRPPSFERTFAAANGIRLVSMNMSPTKEPSDAQIEEFLAITKDPANYPILVHCKQGADRTGLMIALVRVIQEGWNLSDAEKEMSFHRNFSFFTPMPKRKLRQYVKENAIWKKESGGLKNGTEGLKAAADKEIITPAGQIPLAGFAPKRLALERQGDLYARCFVIECPTGERVAFVTLDLIGFIRYDVLEVRREIRKRGIIDPNSLIIASTHQHAGPDMIGMWGRSALPLAPNIAGSGRDENYIAGVREKIIALVERTISKLEKAELSVIEADGEGYSKNIHLLKEVSGLSSSGGLDTSLVTLVARGEHGTIATLTNFGVHPETFKSNQQILSADFPGAFVNKMEKEFGGTALFANGLLGAMVSCRTKLVFRKENPTAADRANALGGGLVERINNKASSENKLDYSDRYLRIRKKIVTLPLENLLFQEGMKTGIIPNNSDILTDENEVMTEVGIVDIGNVRILLVPGEMQPTLGLKIKKMTGAKMIIGLANDEIGYIIPTEDFYKFGIEDPKDGPVDLYKYERTMSLGPETGDRIYQAFEELLTK